VDTPSISESLMRVGYHTYTNTTVLNVGQKDI